MSISKAGRIIRAVLTSTGAITAIVGSKVRPIKAAKADNYPYIIYEKITSPSTQTKDGNSGWYKARFQLSLLATTLDTVEELAKQTQIALEGFSGVIAGFTVQNITFEDERDRFNENSSIDGVYMLQQDYIVTIQL